MSIKYKYLFQIDDTDVYPVWSPTANLKWEEEGEFVFKRLKLNGTFTLTNGAGRKDFNLVWAQRLDHEFTFRAQYIVNGVVADEVNGTFYKTDCPFWDEDNKRVDVVVQTIDRYEKLMKAFDKEFDLVGEIQPEAYKVNYKKEPLIQIAFPYHTQLYQRIGNSTFVQDIPAYTHTNLEDFGFITSGEPSLYIPGGGDMSPDVSGLYEDQGVDGFGNHYYLRTDGIYRIRSVAGIQWYINEVAPNDDLYDTPILPYQADLHTFRSPFTQDIVFTNIADNVTQCAAFPVIPYQRILTDSAFVGVGGTVPTISRPAPDIGDIEFEYSKYVDQSALSPLMVSVVPYDLHSINPTKFGKYNDDAIHFSGEYFAPLEIYGTSKAYPLMMPSWAEYSLIEAVNFSFEDELIEATSENTLRDAYALADCIKKILAAIDPAIYFEATTFCSKFLFHPTNPVSGDAQALTHFITPKSNIIISDYSQPDTKELITFGNIDKLLKAANLWWWIDNQGNFKIEHIMYFKNGRSYDLLNPAIGVNLTTFIEPRTTKYWGYHTNNYRYTKEKMPEQLTFKWMDDASEYFKGYPIKINSGFVEKGLIPDLAVDKFSSDISLAVAFPGNFAVDGFFVMAAENIGGTWSVQYENFASIPLIDILVQNGWWSFYYLHDKFWRHNLPAEDVNINTVDVTAITTKRGKEQDLTFPAGVNPDPTRLVTSGIGNCEIQEMEINLDSRECKIKVLGDLDFDNPCPTC